MVKIRVTSQPKASVRISRFSLWYSGLFTLKLATTPLLAYISEPLPLSIPERSIVVLNSFDTFNNATFDYLHRLYNSKTMRDSHDSHFDSTTITYVECRKLVLPVDVASTSWLSSYFIRFPGAVAYGLGIQTFVMDLLSQDAATRRRNRLFQCQRNYYYGIVLSDSCVWLEPLLLGTSSDIYTVYFGTIVWEGQLWSWLKLAFRSLLTLFILRVLWLRYCCHYLPLLRGLEDIGVDDQFCRYEVIVGDPTYLILSDPRVTTVMVADILLTTPSYVAWSVLRVCQYNDLIAFGLGCLYLTRSVWCGYFAMRCVSYIAKPLCAYLSEPLPWSIPERNIVVWDSFDTFNNATFDYLNQLYNRNTMSGQRDTHFDSSTITYVERHKLVLPVDVASTAWLSSYFIRFPGAVAYGLGIQTFVMDLLSQDAATRRRNRLFQCQRNYYYGIVLSDSCVWLEPLLLGTSSDIYTVYFGTIVWEGQLWSWLKLAFRSLLTLFILRVLWLRYCCHYLPLLRGLEDIGVDDQFYRYEVIVGDPTYLILSDPRVTTVMVADILLTTPSYVAWSVLRVCQYNDLIAFGLGCLYLTRSVWCGYFAMRCVSYIAKVRRWEHKFAPIDPGSTWQYILMAIYLIIWSLFLPSTLVFQAVDLAPGMLIGMTLTGSLPVCLSYAFQKMAHSRACIQESVDEINRLLTRLAMFVCRNRSVHVIRTSIAPTHDGLQKAPSEANRSQRSFNDFKNRFLFAMIKFYSPEPWEKTGGSLHELYACHPEYRQMPLFSCRATDCFILCYTPNGQVQLQVRLSFWIAWTQEPKIH
ncbi:hypothetical protein LEN26_008369 [Aphanomyces euteiches]|nr:hypothetical protein LEN26_008369 [Aphanomyces euteiches]